MSEKKLETVKIGQYLLAKNSKTTYIKFEAPPKADEATKKLVEDLKKVLGGDVIYVNRFDDEFRAKYNIKDFHKGNIEAPKPGSASTTTNSKDEVPF